MLCDLCWNCVSSLPQISTSSLTVQNRLHIGRRFNVEWTPLKLASVALKYVTNVKYIGVCLIAGTHLPARRSKRAVLATATWLAGWLVGCLSHAGIVSKQQNLS